MPSELNMWWGQDNLHVQLGLVSTLWVPLLGPQEAGEVMAWGDSGVGTHDQATHVEIRA
jgi:hypothetical protein